MSSKCCVVFAPYTLTNNVKLTQMKWRRVVLQTHLSIHQTINDGVLCRPQQAGHGALEHNGKERNDAKLQRRQTTVIYVSGNIYFNNFNSLSGQICCRWLSCPPSGKKNKIINFLKRKNSLH